MSPTTIKFCDQCGSSLATRSIDRIQRFYCKRCDRIVYMDPKIAAVALVRKENLLLLVKRAIEPHIGKWSLPSGYVDRGENVESSAIREVKEETNLNVTIEKLQGLYSGIGPVVLAVYQATASDDTDPIPNHETLAVDWFDINNLPHLPFPHDSNIIHDFIKDYKKYITEIKEQDIHKCQPMQKKSFDS